MDKPVSRTLAEAREAIVKARDEMLERVNIFNQMLELMDRAERLDGATATSLAPRKVSRRAVSHRGPTVRQMIQDILRASGRQMHANEIVEALQSQGVELSAKDPKATVVTALLRLSRVTAEQPGPKEGVFALGGNMFLWGFDPATDRVDVAV